MTDPDLLTDVLWTAAALRGGHAPLRLLLELGVHAVEADQGSWLVPDAGRPELVCAMTVGTHPHVAVLEGPRVPLGEGPMGLAAVTREVQVGAPVWSSANGDAAPRVCGPEAVVAAPMVVDDRLLGVLTGVSFRRARRFGVREMQLYGRLATVAAMVVDQRARLEAARVTGAAPREDGHGQDEASQRIASALDRIVAAGEAARARLADLLESVVSLAKVPPPE